MGARAVALQVEEAQGAQVPLQVEEAFRVAVQVQSAQVVQAQEGQVPLAVAVQVQKTLRQEGDEAPVDMLWRLHGHPRSSQIFFSEHMTPCRYTKWTVCGHVMKSQHTSQTPKKYVAMLRYPCAGPPAHLGRPAPQG